MIKTRVCVALIVASSAASAFGATGAFSQVVAELNATASAGARGSAANVSFTRPSSSPLGLPTGGSDMSNAGGLVDLTNVLDGTAMSPVAAINPGSWALRGSLPPVSDTATGISSSGPDPVTVIPLPSALGLAGVGLLGLTIRRRSGK